MNVGQTITPNTPPPLDGVNIEEIKPEKTSARDGCPFFRLVAKVWRAVKRAFAAIKNFFFPSPRENFKDTVHIKRLLIRHKKECVKAFGQSLVGQPISQDGEISATQTDSASSSSELQEAQKNIPIEFIALPKGEEYKNFYLACKVLIDHGLKATFDRKIEPNVKVLQKILNKFFEYIEQRTDDAIDLGTEFIEKLEAVDLEKPIDAEFKQVMTWLLKNKDAIDQEEFKNNLYDKLGKKFSESQKDNAISICTEWLFNTDQKKALILNGGKENKLILKIAFKESIDLLAKRRINVFHTYAKEVIAKDLPGIIENVMINKGSLVGDKLIQRFLEVLGATEFPTAVDSIVELLSDQFAAIAEAEKAKEPARKAEIQELNRIFQEYVEGTAKTVQDENGQDTTEFELFSDKSEKKWKEAQGEKAKREAIKDQKLRTQRLEMAQKALNHENGLLDKHIEKFNKTTDELKEQKGIVNTIKIRLDTLKQAKSDQKHIDEQRLFLEEGQKKLNKIQQALNKQQQKVDSQQEVVNDQEKVVEDLVKTIEKEEAELQKKLGLTPKNFTLKQIGNAAQKIAEKKAEQQIESLHKKETDIPAGEAPPAKDNDENDLDETINKFWIDGKRNEAAHQKYSNFKLPDGRPICHPNIANFQLETDEESEEMEQHGFFHMLFQTLPTLLADKKEGSLIDESAEKVMNLLFPSDESLLSWLFPSETNISQKKVDLKEKGKEKIEGTDNENIKALSPFFKKIIESDSQIKEIYDEAKFIYGTVLTDENRQNIKNFIEVSRPFMCQMLPPIIQVLSEPIKDVLKTFENNIIRNVISTILTGLFQQLIIPERIHELAAYSVLPALEEKMVQVLAANIFASNNNTEKFAPLILALFENQDYSADLTKDQIIPDENAFKNLLDELKKLVEENMGNFKIDNDIFDSLIQEELEKIITSLKKPIVEKIIELKENSESEDDSIDIKIFKDFCAQAIKTYYSTNALGKGNTSHYGDLVVNAAFNLGGLNGMWGWAATFVKMQPVKNIISTLIAEVMNDLQKSPHFLLQMGSEFIKETFAKEKKDGSALFDEEKVGAFLFDNKKEYKTSDIEQKLSEGLTKTAQIAHAILKYNAQDLSSPLKMGVISTIGDKDEKFVQLVRDIYEKTFTDPFYMQNLVVLIQAKAIQALQEGAERVPKAQAAAVLPKMNVVSSEHNGDEEDENLEGSMAFYDCEGLSLSASGFFDISSKTNRNNTTTTAPGMVEEKSENDDLFQTAQEFGDYV